MTFDDLVQQAASAYLGHLRNLRAGAGTVFAAALDALTSSLDAALKNRVAIDFAECAFSVNDLARLSVDERGMLLNQYALGLGRPDRPVLVVGTEHAYEIGRDEDLVNFCLESCAEPLVILTDGRSDLVEQITAGAVALPPDRPFHVYPNDHYREGGTHTWARLAQVVGTGGEHRPGAHPGLGDLCYQLELSAFPSQRNADGRLPSQERLKFLERAMPVFARSASVLLFHGKASDFEWAEVRAPLIASFLGRTPGRGDWVDESDRKLPLRHVTIGTRRVIVTRALANAGVTREFLGRLAELVRLGTPRVVDPRWDRDPGGPEAFDVTDLEEVLSDEPTLESDGTEHSMDRYGLVKLAVQEGLDTNRQAQWTQIGPEGATGHGARDSRIFYVNHHQDIVDLRRNSGPADLMQRARAAGGDIVNGQIVARIPIGLFSDDEWVRFVRHNA